ncbi:MAG TPA: IclR family transcriptional regulator [Solirubrobacteraceae bacterium]|nr:IclR family transcriptional regulator [Solirubrobacteraceae bacterium]
MSATASVKAENTVSVQIQSIERAATVLRLLTGRPRRGVAELARELQVPKGTAYGILRTLEMVGFVEQDRESGKYQIGPALLHIGSRYLEDNELRLRALPWSDTLAAQAGESVRIGTPHDNLVLVIHHVIHPDDTPQPVAVGDLIPMHATAVGKALLAHNRDLASAIAGSELARCTSGTVTDPEQLRQQLEKSADRGWSDDVGEFLPGVASIAAPIEGRHRAVVGAIAISGPIDRLCVDRSPRRELAGQVMNTARAIARDLGWTPW